MKKGGTQDFKTTDKTSHYSADNALWLLDFYTMQGRKSENQDSLLITTCLPYGQSTATTNGSVQCPHAPLLVLMADGVSACQFPKQASQLVVNTITHHLTLALENLVRTEYESASENESQANGQKAPISFDDNQIAILIKEAVNKTNDVLYFPQVYERVPPLLSTLSGLLCIGDRIHLFHTGDSRIYRIGMDSMAVLTKDHRIHRGQDKGALSAAVGADTRIQLQQSVFTLHQNECLALMTDGVYESITASELQFELCAAASALVQSTTIIDQDPVDRQRSDVGIGESLDISKSLCEQAFSEGSYDNLSMMMLGMNTPMLHKQTFKAQTYKTGDNASSHNIHRYQLPTGLEIGAQIDGFTVKNIIARTARSEVYLVEDSNHHAFVIKSPSLDTITDGYYLREFLKERKIGLSLSKHRRAGEPAYNQADPNDLSSDNTLISIKTNQSASSALSSSGLLRYYPVPASSIYLYHLTEYIEGESLRDFMDRHAPCDVWQTYDLLTKIGMAVRVMHRNYLLHQDIKPENILLTTSGAVKLIDFGSASSLILKDSTRPPNGDLHYAAPEYYSDAPKGVYSDLFSIAVIGYELLTNELPFSSQDLMSSHQASHTLTLPAQSVRQHRVPTASQQALMRALHSNTQARYQAIGEFLQDFNPDNTSNIRDPEPLIIRHPLLVWHSICFIQFVIILSLLAYFL
ncbi:bifunctional protein-serine/threonine kinase/phosphatase [Psychrobacter glaciei]|uniref:bifunctional protein-serine/threonine kinase/phosphatase n=1 Tax=Psychrobacter glaciei TaxID=619771 RepID=UPI001F06D1ED|nr:bifunctional protein-serine/threonine kinase/phosphatase [Psychrobacter glaciei]MCH1782663.1 bifunctional serine/threonine-protein phosphatase/kinase [Psychrobacter glaciei]